MFKNSIFQCRRCYSWSQFGEFITAEGNERFVCKRCLRQRERNLAKDSIALDASRARFPRRRSLAYGF